ncbi:hypothetical protein [Streptomyces sp. NPDC019890]|uniref:hypothetical protein n=1 Tax=Streptomyces sp. NPDC019890 TaxID=3365064 RepID=UPI0038509DAF
MADATATAAAILFLIPAFIGSSLPVSVWRDKGIAAWSAWLNHQPATTSYLAGLDIHWTVIEIFTSASCGHSTEAEDWEHTTRIDPGNARTIKRTVTSLAVCAAVSPQPHHPARSHEPVELTVPEIRHLLAAALNRPACLVTGSVLPLMNAEQAAR